MDINKMNRAELEVAILENDVPCDPSKVIKMTDDEVRAFLAAWIEAGDECAGC
jgi:hypothetical protein